MKISALKMLNFALLSFAPVVVAMSGGVDSSVTAKLLADKVRNISHVVASRRQWSFPISRITTFRLCLCAIGTPATSLVQTMDVSGRKIGKTSDACAEYWIFLVKWYVLLSISCLLSFRVSL